MTAWKRVVVLGLLVATLGLADSPKPCRRVDTIVADLKVGECGFIWIVFRDADGSYLLFRPETISSKWDTGDSWVERRADGFHVWIERKEVIDPARDPLWLPMFVPVKVHRR